MALRNRRRNAVYLVVLAGLLAVVWASNRSLGTSSTPEKPLSELLTALDDRQVASGTFNTDGDRVDWLDRQGRHYRTLIAGGYTPTLVATFRDDQVPFDVTQSSSTNVWLSVVLPNVILLVLVGGFLWYLLRYLRRVSPPS